MIGTEKHPATEKDILVLAYEPSQTELAKKKSGEWKFRDGGARLLFGLIRSCGLHWANMHFDYIQDEKGQDQLEELISVVKPKVIVTLGEEALHAVAGEEFKFTQHRGNIVEGNVKTHGITILPTYDHRTINKRRWSKTGSGTANHAATLQADMKKAQRISEGNLHRPKENFNLEPSIEDIRKFLQDSIDGNYPLCADIEADGLNEQRAQAVVLGLAKDRNTALVIPFYDQHARSPYGKEGDLEVRLLVQNYFLNGPGLIWQNGYKYDIPVLTNEVNNFDMPQKAFHGDTLIMYNTLNPEFPANIGFLASLYSAVPYWKDSFLSRKESIWETDQIEMRRYNARDTATLWDIYNGIKKDLENENLWDVYKSRLSHTEWTMPMTKTGIYIDKNRHNWWNQKIKKELERLDIETKSFYDLPESFKLSSDEHIRYLLFNVEPNALIKAKEEITDYDSWTQYQAQCQKCQKTKWLSQSECKIAMKELKSKCMKCKKPTPHMVTDLSRPGKQKDQDTKKYEKLIETLDLVDCNKNTYKLNTFKPRTTDTGHLQVDSKTRATYALELNKRRDEVKNLKRPRKSHEQEINDINVLLQFLDSFNEWARVQKMHSAYRSFPVDEQNIFHPPFNVSVTASGRLSSPAQQFPSSTTNPDFRKIFTVNPKYDWILSFDYEGLENYVLAYASGDEELQRVLNELNLHDENTKTLFNIDSTHPKWSAYRSLAKIFQFGGVAYGGGDREILTQMNEKMPDNGLSIDLYRKAKARYYKRFTGVKAWQDNARKLAHEKRIAYGIFGFNRKLFGNERDIEKIGLNHPIQNGAAEVINDTTKRITRKLKEANIESPLFLQVHDENNFYVKDKHLKATWNIIRAEVAQPFVINNKKCYFKIDAELGKSLGELHAFDEETMKPLEQGGKH